MNETSILQEIGLNEIARKTHIEAEYVGYIIDRNYEKLARLNVRGFIKILEREYNVNFKEWLEEYDQFVSKHKDETPQKSTAIFPKISSYTSTGKKSSWGLFWLLIILIVVSFLVWFFEGYKHIGSISSLFEDKNRSVSYTNTVVVEEAEKNINSIKETNVTINLPAPIAKQNIEQKPELIIVSAPIPQEEPAKADQIDENESKEQPKPEEKVQKIEPETILQIDTSKVNQIKSTEIGSQYITTGLNEVKIHPRKKVWIGIIDLESSKKRSVDTDKPLNIILDKKQLVVTGHGSINLDIDGEVVKFSTDNPKRFLVEQDKITLISYDDFVSLNKGKSW
ncbi:phosphatidylglycerophosphate synthase [Campylobacter sp. RM16187]|uniref:phosphatidylglycerophosphate synthase n=1 Tax=Campylobacter sp. RM16187 TaxID=1660063 RepID=UPI0021B5B802|nr:phosphatidylglycerophosphate synthase [Campylobacter sp. RM16187]QKG28524.1 hypothetical protein CDOMF_0234 [Campylobacter sp. RM16187]